ncbi:hypothetical protein [Rhodococcus sp. CH91]|uniref:hypothetical protein n=1 Tax=Rhodococcus sp. CH91 TaxID=2910256 RepID=UPI001F4B3276|nr:hypothetical protein [Rhodococcus sp. CH91]
MSIDTFVAGDPAAILRVGDRLRRTVAVALEAAADDAAAARRSADDGWDGEASDRYLREASRLVVRIDTVHGEILEVAVVFDRISAALSSVLDDMAAIRRRASAAGLMVVCDVIGDPPPGSDPSVIRAYDECAAAAEDVHARWAREVAAVTHRWTSKAWAATFTITTGLAASIVAGSLAGAAVPFIGPVGGALIGTTVGIMTSGGVDHLYENSSTTAWSTVNASIGEAEDALHALKDLGGAVLGGLVDAE